MKLLCISNGHGEDAIALPVLQELRKLSQAPEIVTLPIVGVGKVYTSNNFLIVGKVQTLPSGGFLNQDHRQLVRDLQGGLVGLTIDQLRVGCGVTFAFDPDCRRGFLERMHVFCGQLDFRAAKVFLQP